jgi:hypothetical protein
MNLKGEIVTFPKNWKPIPRPYYVVRIDDHCTVCTLDKDFNLIDEISVIHWNKYTVRRWALKYADEAKFKNIP